MPTERERNLFVGSITTGHFVIHWYQQLLPVVTPTIKAALALDNVQVGMLSSARLLSTSLVTLPLGMLSDSHRRQRALFLGGAIAAMGAGYFVAGALATFQWVLLGCLLLGVGAAAWHPTALAALSLRYPSRRGTMLSIHGTAATIGDTVTPLVVGSLLAVVAWQPLFVVQIVPALACAVILWRALAPTFGSDPAAGGTNPGRRRQIEDVGALIHHRIFIGIALAAVLLNVGRQVVLTFLPIYLQEDLGYSTVALGFYLALLYGLGIASQTALGMLSDRFGRRIVLVPSVATLGTLYILLAYAPPGLALGAVIGAIGVFFYTLTNITSAAMLDVVEPRIHASAQAFLSVLTQGLVLPAPVLAGAMIRSHGIATVFVLCGVLALTAAAVLLPLGMRRGTSARPA